MYVDTIRQVPGSVTAPFVSMMDRDAGIDAIRHTAGGLIASYTDLLDNNGHPGHNARAEHAALIDKHL